MWLAFSKEDNSYQMVVLGSCDIGAPGKYEWYFVEDADYDQETDGIPVSYTPSGEFTPDINQSMQIDSGGSINYPE